MANVTIIPPRERTSDKLCQGYFRNFKDRLSFATSGPLLFSVNSVYDLAGCIVNSRSPAAPYAASYFSSTTTT